MTKQKQKKETKWEVIEKALGISSIFFKAKNVKAKEKKKEKDSNLVI